jgi:hypothetical protein
MSPTSYLTAPPRVVALIIERERFASEAWGSSSRPGNQPGEWRQTAYPPRVLDRERLLFESSKEVGKISAALPVWLVRKLETDHSDRTYKERKMGYRN